MGEKEKKIYRIIVNIESFLKNAHFLTNNIDNMEGLKLA